MKKRALVLQRRLFTAGSTALGMTVFGALIALYWFLCRTCGRRCWRLHQSPRTRRFVCRTCADRRYRSSQEAHKYRGFYTALAAEMSGTYTARELEDPLTGRW